MRSYSNVGGPGFGDMLPHSIAAAMGSPPEALLSGKENAVLAKAVLAHQSFQNLWPHYFTFACLAFFGVPMIAGISLAQDPSVHFWVGRWGYLPSVIPLYLAALHVFHLRLGPPKLIPVVLGTVLPCFVVLLVSNTYLQGINSIPSALASSDCTTFPIKTDVQRSWVAAVSVYERCVNRTARERSLSYENALVAVRLQDCTEWRKDPDSHRATWLYLKYLEETTGCAGWCWPSRPLWTYGEVKDACSTAAGALLFGKAIPLASKMMFLSLAGLLTAIGGIVYVSAQMQAEGKEWDRF